MRRMKPLGVLLLIPAACLFFSAPGCGKKEEPAPAAKGDGNKDKDKNKNGGKKASSEPTELATTDWGTLSGTITYDGEPPTPKKIKMEGNKNEKQCHDTKNEREIIDQTWLVNKENKGVSDVIIFLKAPEGKYFKIHPSYKDKAKKPILLHQPHCVFIPHAFTYWASSYDKDTKDFVKSGQKIQIKNDAAFPHNTGWSGTEDNPQSGQTLEPGKELFITLNAQADSPVGFKCDIHPWMNARCWALDHPYAARTDKDGKFTIENVPAGAEVYIVGWHDGAGFFNDGAAGKAMKLEKGDNTLNLKIKAK